MLLHFKWCRRGDLSFLVTLNLFQGLTDLWFYARTVRCCTAAAPSKDRVTAITFGSAVPFVKRVQHDGFVFNCHESYDFGTLRQKKILANLDKTCNIYCKSTFLMKLDTQARRLGETQPNKNNVVGGTCLFSSP